MSRTLSRTIFCLTTYLRSFCYCIIRRYPFGCYFSITYSQHFWVTGGPFFAASRLQRSLFVLPCNFIHRRYVYNTYSSFFCSSYTSLNFIPFLFSPSTCLYPSSWNNCSVTVLPKICHPARSCSNGRHGVILVVWFTKKIEKASNSSPQASSMRWSEQVDRTIASTCDPWS